MKWHNWSFSILILLFGVTMTGRAQEPTTLTLLTHDSFSVSEEVLQAFEAQTGITVEILRSGDAGTMVNQAILTKDNPLADVMFGVDNTFLGRALAADLFIPYESPLLANVPADFHLDAENRVTPVDYGDIALNADTAFFEENELELPQSLADLTLPAYKGLLVVENPVTSSPGLAFLLMTVDVFGTEGDYTWLDYWRDLNANDIYISDGWTDAYYTQFSGSAGSQGTRPLVVSYASSPPAEVYFADPQPDTAPTVTLVAEGMTFRQVEFVGILRGTEKEAEAQQFIDFVLSVPFQEDMPLQMYVFPVNSEASLPDVFAEYAAIPEQPLLFDVDEINTNREMWLQEWTETILR